MKYTSPPDFVPEDIKHALAVGVASIMADDHRLAKNYLDFGNKLVDHFDLAKQGA